MHDYWVFIGYLENFEIVFERLYLDLGPGKGAILSFSSCLMHFELTFRNFTGIRIRIRFIYCQIESRYFILYLHLQLSLNGKIEGHK